MSKASKNSLYTSNSDEHYTPKKIVETVLKCFGKVDHFSGGVSSYVAAKRVIDKYGKDDVIMLFCDTLIEDEDLYRFNKDTEQSFGLDLTVIADGRDPFQLFKDERYLGNAQRGICSLRLKRDLADNWVKDRFRDDECIQYFGLDYSEMHRIERLTDRKLPYQCNYPLIWKPVLTKEQIFEIVKGDGIEIPRLYKWAYHNNCGGGCVKAGISHWRDLFLNMPERFKWWEDKKQELRAFPEKPVTITNYMEKGKKINITLAELRQQWEKQPSLFDGLFEYGGCGCAV